MKITVRVVVDSGDGQPATSHDVAVLARENLTPATAGLRVEEAHQILAGLQQHLVAAQAATAAEGMPVVSSVKTTISC